MLNVICVLRSGGEYRVEHATALAVGIRNNLLTVPYRFICLTDLVQEVESVGISAVQLPKPWPGWWSKICLFAPGLFSGPCWYADLDTILVRPIDDLVLGHRFTVLRNFWSDRRIGSGLMAWDCDLSPIYYQFAREAKTAIDTYRTKERWGDQGYIAVNTPVEPDLWQVRHPGRIISYKRNFVERRGIPPDASIICYHGLPRPWSTPLWNRYATGSSLK